jgi:hypothetical protein
MATKKISSPIAKAEPIIGDAALYIKNEGADVILKDRTIKAGSVILAKNQKEFEDILALGSRFKALIVE